MPIRIPIYRTSDAHIILYNLINRYCHKKGSKIYGCFVDFSKAFDSLPRDLLFQKLSDIGVSGKFYEIIKSLYKDDKICIKMRYYTDKEKFIFIMTSPSLMGNVSIFLENALNDRDIYLEVARELQLITLFPSNFACL